jgi:hypothetical protein
MALDSSLLFEYGRVLMQLNSLPWHEAAGTADPAAAAAAGDHEQSHSAVEEPMDFPHGAAADGDDIDTAPLVAQGVETSIGVVEQVTDARWKWLWRVRLNIPAIFLIVLCEAVLGGFAVVRPSARRVGPAHRGPR